MGSYTATARKQDVAVEQQRHSAMSLLVSRPCRLTSRLGMAGYGWVWLVLVVHRVFLDIGYLLHLNSDLT